MMSKPSCGFLLPLLLLAGSQPALAVDIDGRVSDSEWQGAEHISEFRKTQPLTGEPPSHATEAWILATPEGLAVAFRNTQPTSVPRTHGDRPSQSRELSPTELRVLRYLPTNLTRHEIASELYLSVNTVNTHIRNVYSKLGTRDRSSAVQRARELRLLSSRLARTSQS